MGRAKIVIPLAAAAAIDDGFEPYDASVIIRWCVVILVLSAIAAVCASVRWYSAFYCGHRAEHVLRSELFAHLQELHFGYHDRAQIGNLMARRTSTCARSTTSWCSRRCWWRTS